MSRQIRSDLIREAVRHLAAEELAAQALGLPAAGDAECGGDERRAVFPAFDSFGGAEELRPAHKRRVGQRSIEYVNVSLTRTGERGVVLRDLLRQLRRGRLVKRACGKVDAQPAERDRLRLDVRRIDLVSLMHSVGEFLQLRGRR